MTQVGAGHRPSLYFSFGVNKTGSTLAYRMARHFLECRGYPQPDLPAEMLVIPSKVNFWGGENADRLDAIADWAAAQGVFLVIKTHRGPNALIERLLADGRAVAHATYRDPREIALSMLDHGARSRVKGGGVFMDFTSVRDCENSIAHQLGVFDRWEALPHVEPWYYDDFAFNPATGFERMAQQLGLDPLTAEEHAAFDATRGTKFNKAAPERWRTDLSEDDSAHFQQVFADFYKKLDARRAVRSQPSADRLAKKAAE